MQATIYYREEDEYLLEKVEKLARRKRKSKSAMILSILEEYFEGDKKVGQILKDIGAVSPDQLKKALQKQKNGNHGKRLGEILLDQGIILEIDLDRALELQNKNAAH